MGYHLTVLRTVGGRSDPISQPQIRAAISALPGWTFDGDKNIAAFSGENGLTFWLTYDPEVGELWLKGDEASTSDSGLNELVRLADRLSARLRGDEFETYRSASDTYTHPDDQAELLKAKQTYPARHRRNVVWDYARITILVIIAGFLIVRVLGVL